MFILFVFIALWAQWLFLEIQFSVNVNAIGIGREPYSVILYTPGFLQYIQWANDAKTLDR